ncbi:DUF2510 domain-containing protein [Streptosporangium vulgare]|uniref:DUF2510 domain-containing protein n=2 Tax=Streptosporangium vulgare TaxID=46190 RepID=A0ABV5T9Q4_9ACTN
MTTQTPSGWYPDPYGSPLLRWWDGSEWTDATHQTDAPTGQGTAPGSQTGPFLQQHSAGPGPQQTGPHPAGPGPQQTGPRPTQEGPRGTGPSGSFPSGPSGPPAPSGPSGQWSPPAAHQQGAQAPTGAGQPHWGGPPNGHTAQMPLPPYDGYPSAPPPRKSGPLPWILGGGGVLVLIVVIVVAAMYLINPERRNTAGEPTGLTTPPPTAPLEPSQEPTPEATPAPSGSAPPKAVDGRVTDPVTGLSYEMPGEPWEVPPSVGGGLGFVWSSAAVAVAQENFDGRGGDWLGNVLTGELPDQYGYQGVGSMRSVAATLLQVVEPAFYTPPHSRKIVEDKAVKVSGKDAWLLVFDLDFSEQAEANGWKWKQERAAFLIVDRGENTRPALAYISVPDNLDISVADKVIKSFKLP